MRVQVLERKPIAAVARDRFVVDDRGIRVTAYTIREPADGTETVKRCHQWPGYLRRASQPNLGAF